MAGPRKEQVGISVQKVETDSLSVCVLGVEPIIMNRMSQKARQELLLPRGRMSAADKAVNIKHNPREEYRSSVYKLVEPNAPTLIAMPSTAFKGAMGTAALDLPGTKKAQIGRLTWVTGTYVPIYGTPQLFMSVVRSADINRTPDIRTRAILPQWAAVVNITYVKPLITEQAVANIISAAGLTAGIADWRSEKGKGNFGQFRIVNEDDPEFRAVLAQGRAVQEAGLATPVCYDDETSELLSWFDDELTRRIERGKIGGGKKAVVAAKTNTNGSGDDVTA